MKFKDKEGFGFTEGCLVKVVSALGKKWRGWITEIDEERGLLLVVCERRAGAPRFVEPSEATVVKPSGFDTARRTGTVNMTDDMSRQLKPSRRLAPRKKD